MARVILLNKPFNVLSQFTDKGTEGSARETLSSYVKVPGVYPAGRLDRDSEGLLILTDDGKLQARISNPKFKQPKKVEFIDAIPRNPTGKVLKRVLRDQFAGVTAE